MIHTRPQSSLARWLAAGVFVAAVVAFSPIVRNHFIHWDDEIIAKNSDFLVEKPGESAADKFLFKWGKYWSGPNHHLYMPLTYTFWGELSLVTRTPAGQGGGSTLSPEIFHAVSLMLHAVNAVLVFLLLRRLVKADWPAFFGALLFAVHPLQTESVAWVAETSILLSGVFSLWAILEYLRFSDLRAGTPAENPETHFRPRAWIHYGVGTAVFALALLSKPSTVVVPFIVIVIEIVLRRHGWRAVLGPMSLWLAMCVPISILTRHWQPTSFTFPLWQRPIIAADALGFYLYKLVAPVNLSINYCRTPNWLFAHHAIVAITWIAPVALGLGAMLLWKRARWFTACVILFVVPLIPVLGFTVFTFQQYSTTADRYVYLAMLGPAIAAAMVISHVPGRTAWILSGVVLLGLTCLSIHQALLWFDTLTLFTPVVAAHPESHLAQERMALGYTDQSREQTKAGNRDGAVASLVAAREHYLLAAGLAEERGYDLVQAANCGLDTYELVSDTRTGPTSLHAPLLRQAIADANEALRDPNFQLQALAYMTIANAYESLDDVDSASAALEQAMQASTAPQLAPIHDDVSRRKASLDLMRAMRTPPATREHGQ